MVMERSDSVGNELGWSMPACPAIASPAVLNEPPVGAPALLLLGAPPSSGPSPPTVMVRGCSDEDLPQLAAKASTPQALTTIAPLKLAAREANGRQHSTHKNDDGGPLSQSPPSSRLVFAWRSPERAPR